MKLTVAELFIMGEIAGIGMLLPLLESITKLSVPQQLNSVIPKQKGEFTLQRCIKHATSTAM